MSLENVKVVKLIYFQLEGADTYYRCTSLDDVEMMYGSSWESELIFDWEEEDKILITKLLKGDE